jgi:hypothetical protein
MKRSKRLSTSILRKLGLKAEHSINRQLNAENERESPTHETSSPPPITRAVIEIPTFLDEYRVTQKQQHSDNKKALWVTAATALGAFIYAAIAAYQYCEMRKANRLTLQALSGTQGAIIEPLGSMPRDKPADGSIALEFTNSGKVSAHAFEINLWIVAKSLPTLVENRQHRTPRSDKANSIPPTVPSFTDPFHVDCRGITWLQSDGSDLRMAKETVIVEGAFSYLNGIEEIPKREDFCWAWIDTSTIPSEFGLGSGPNWLRCSILPWLAAAITEAHKEQTKK